MRILTFHYTSSLLHQLYVTLQIGCFLSYTVKKITFQKYLNCSGPWKPGSRRRLSWRGVAGETREGVGNLGWGGDEKGEVSLQVTWDQGGRDRITPKEGFQVSKREREESNGELARGAKQGNCAIIVLSICICVYNNCLNVECN